MMIINDYAKIHKWKPVGQPCFSIVSDDKTVVTEIEGIDIDNCSTTGDSVSIVTNLFFNLNNSAWTSANGVEHSFDITYTQVFMNPVTGESVIFEKVYSQYYLDSHGFFFSTSTRNITYDYYFRDKETHKRFKEQEIN